VLLKIPYSILKDTLKKVKRNLIVFHLKILNENYQEKFFSDKKLGLLSGSPLESVGIKWVFYWNNWIKTCSIAFSSFLEIFGDITEKVSSVVKVVLTFWTKVELSWREISSMENFLDK